MELEIIHGDYVKLTFDINHNELPKTTTHYLVLNNRFINKIHISTFEVRIFSTVTSLSKIMLNGNLAFIRLRKTGVEQTMINCNRLNHAKLVVRYGCTR